MSLKDNSSYSHNIGKSNEYRQAQSKSVMNNANLANDLKQHMSNNYFKSIKDQNKSKTLEKTLVFADIKREVDL